MNDPIGHIQGAVTPESIDGADFKVRMRGYDRDEVDTFLSLLSDEVHHLAQRAAAAEDESRFEALGREAGELLQVAADAAAAIRAAAGTDAAAERELIEQERDETRTELARLRKEAEQDIDRMLTDASAQASEIRQTAERHKADGQQESDQLKRRTEDEVADLRKRAQAEYTVLIREAKRNASLIEKEAFQQAEQTKDAAEEQALQRIEKGRTELRRLREIEMGLKQRIQELQGRAAAAEHRSAEVSLNADAYSTLAD